MHFSLVLPPEPNCGYEVFFDAGVLKTLFRKSYPLKISQVSLREDTRAVHYYVCEWRFFRVKTRV
jgi:hypothetical protein